MKKPLRIVFAGTPDFAAQHLAALLLTNHEVVAVYTQPDRPAGRGKKLQASPVKQLALENNISVEQPESFKEELAVDTLKQWDCDVMVVVAYGIILPQRVLDVPRNGCLNVHGSLLPKWRGAAPIQRAIWAGDSETGVTIMQMDAGLDTGPMLYKQSVPIQAEDTSDTLYDKLAEIGPAALIHTLDNLSSVNPEHQNDTNATYAKKLSKEEAQIDWSDSANQLERNIRAFNPWPVAWFPNNDERIKIWKASVIKDSSSRKCGEIVSATKDGIVVQTGKGQLCLETLQIPGKKPAKVGDILNSRADWFFEGKILS